MTTVSLSATQDRECDKSTYKQQFWPNLRRRPALVGFCRLVSSLIFVLTVAADLVKTWNKYRLNLSSIQGSQIVPFPLLYPTMQVMKVTISIPEMLHHEPTSPFEIRKLYHRRSLASFQRISCPTEFDSTTNILQLPTHT